MLDQLRYGQFSDDLWTMGRSNRIRSSYHDLFATSEIPTRRGPHAIGAAIAILKLDKILNDAANTTTDAVAAPYTPGRRRLSVAMCRCFRCGIRRICGRQEDRG